MSAKRYEAAWIVFSLAAALLFIAISGIYAFGQGFHTPNDATTVDPTNLPYDTFGNPQVLEVVPGKKYEVYMVARMYSFSPNPVSVPAGAEVTFHVTSPDVTHGLEIIGSNVNVMVLPGYVSTFSTTFDKPGEYGIICHEYCGSGHHLMRGKLVVTSNRLKELKTS